MTPAVPSRPRLHVIDLVRGLALVAMAIYHFGWDLEFFGYMDPGTTAFGGWRIFARSIASSFLFLVGVSLFLAHADGFRRRGYLKRLATVAAAAAGISAVTYLAVPNGFIFFGILHQIAMASVLGLAFLRLPAPLVLATAAAVIAAPHFLRNPFFDHPAWWWVGLSSVNPRANDYVPLFPWFGVVLAGLGAAKLARGAGLFDRLARLRPTRWATPIEWFGRHSLSFYLIHQPVLIGCVWLMSQIAPPPPVPPQTRFTQACTRQCGEQRDAAFCVRYCDCMLGELDRAGLMDRLLAGNSDSRLQGKVGEIASVCTFEAEEPAPDSQPQ